MESLTGDVNQLFGIHVVENPFGIFAVTAAFHDGQQQFGGVVLQFENQVHSSLAQRIDVGQQESRDDVEPIRFVSSDAVLVLVARALTVFGQRFQRLVDQRCVVLVDVQTEQSQLARRRSANAVEKHERLRDQVVAVFVRLDSEKVLQDLQTNEGPTRLDR